MEDGSDRFLLNQEHQNTGKRSFLTRLSFQSKQYSTLNISERRFKKINSIRGVNALFCGIIFGFLFSFLVAYNGIIESNDGNFAISNLLKRNTTETKQHENVNLAEYLYNKERVLCIVMTSTEALTHRGHIIMDTWGKRCNKILFFSEEKCKSKKKIYES